MEALRLTPDFTYALDRMEDGASLFITGRAGTGKSTLLRLFQQTTSRRVVVLAPTGVAALNVKGQTIHSFFGFPPRLIQAKDVRINRRYQRLYERIDTLVIDEISMVRADVLDAIDKSLRLHRGIPRPFGGVQLILFGDLFQLPPVVSSQAEKLYFKEYYPSAYFFAAHALDEIDLEMIELEQVYRQTNKRFLRLLESIRMASADEEDLAELNQRFMPDFDPSGLSYLTLAARNATVMGINQRELAANPNPAQIYLAEVKGNFPDKLYPAPAVLNLKVGAQVMAIRNDSERRFVNGSIGMVTACDKDEATVVFGQGEQMQEVKIGLEEWEILKYQLKEDDPSQITTEAVGTFKQLPLKLAWAVTIHKAQGKTFDRVIIDMGRGAFEHGQTYVALSRCRTLEGIILSKKLSFRDLLVDEQVVEYYQMMRS
ncbi:MAG: AAA family ATPase [Bacteroidota bacterium]